MGFPGIIRQRKGELQNDKTKFTETRIVKILMGVEGARAIDGIINGYIASIAD